MKKSLVQLKKVNLTLSGVPILENINLDIHEGETVAIIGMNGSGKTSLLRVILGLYKPTKGSIKVNTKKIGYVPQKLEFDRTIPLRVDEFLKTFSPVSEEEIMKELESFNAAHLIPKQLKHLSGGELQKVLIVNALLKKPDLLLLDEATAGIDIHGEEIFYKTITDISKKYNITIVLVSHDIHHVYSQASKVVCLHKHICCVGAPKDVVTDKVFKEQFGPYLKMYEHEKHHEHNH